jgi:hypothetical protein
LGAINFAAEAAKWLDGALMGITFDAAGNRDRPKVDGLTAADPTDPRKRGSP